jgi:hypothetical protein
MLFAGPMRASSASATSGASAAEHLHAVTDNAKFASLLAVGFPSIKFQSPFNQDRRSFAQVFASDFRRSSPKGDIHKGRLIDPLAAGGFPSIIHCHADISHRGSARCVFQLDVACQIAN